MGGLNNGWLHSLKSDFNICFRNYKHIWFSFNHCIIEQANIVICQLLFWEHQHLDFHGPLYQLAIMSPNMFKLRNFHLRYGFIYFIQKTS